MSESSIRISSFPRDNTEYVVMGYGLIRKNNFSFSTVYLVEVYLQNRHTNKKVTIEMLITYIIVARIGTVWKNQQLVKEYSPINRQKYKVESRKFEFDILSPPSTVLLTIDRITGGKKMVAKDNYKGNDDVLSVFTVFTHNDIQVVVPALDIFATTFIPQTHTILHDLITLHIDEVINKHVIECFVKKEKNKIVYQAKYANNYSLSTKVFLAYAACNERTRKNLSKIRSSIIKNCIQTENMERMYMEVFPYHPDKFVFTGLGLYDKNNKIFWVHRIIGYKLPESCYVEIEESDGENEDTVYKNVQRKIYNDTAIKDEIPLTSDLNAGRNAGKKYIKSGVDIDIPDDKIIYKKSAKKTKVLTGKVDFVTPIAASASPMSGQNASRRIATVDYKRDTKEYEKGYLQILIEILMEKPSRHVRFLDDSANEYIDLVFCTLPKRKNYKGQNTGWAFVSKDTPRKLMVCRILVRGRYIYLLDIQRKNKENYAGIAFGSDRPITAAELEYIRETLSVNMGRVGGAKHKRRFPVNHYKTFRHYRDKQTMAANIESIIDSV